MINFLDGFCGAGGASLGITRAGEIKDKDGKVVENLIKVAVAVNHDPRAIWAHNANHPDTHHLNSDIRDVDVAQLVADLAAKGEGLNAIWWSAECTHFSNAKGGASRDADSRMLSEELIRYTRDIDPDWIYVENVKEFFSWCPLLPKVKAKKRSMVAEERRYSRIQIEMFDAVALGNKVLKETLSAELDGIYAEFQKSGRYQMDEDGKVTMLPDSRTRGMLYLRWVQALKDLGYNYDYRMLNAADFGAYQSRERYFGVFVRKSLNVPIQFPNPTHAKVPKAGTLFQAGLQPWKPCKDILDLDDRGESIFFGRKGRPRLVPATLARIRYGIIKFKDQGEVVMVDRSNTGVSPTDTGNPLPTVRASFQNGVVHVTTVDNCTFGQEEQSLDNPIPTVMAKRDKYLMQAFVVPTSFTNLPISMDTPLPTLIAARKHQYLCTPFVTEQYGTGNVKGIGESMGTVMAKDKFGLCTPFIAQSFSSDGNPQQVSSCDSPLWTVTTSNKAYLAVPFIIPQYGQSKATGGNEPLGCVTVNPKHSYNLAFMAKHYMDESNVSSVNEPSGTVTCKDRFSLLQCSFLNYYYGGGQGNSDKRSTSLETPVNTIGTHHLPTYIDCDFVSIYHGGAKSNRAVSTGEPLRTLTTENRGALTMVRMVAANDSIPIVLQTAPKPTKRGNVIVPAWTRVINGYQVDNRIIDIHYRMLKVSELKLAQGFPKDYILDPSSETVAKKHIGNAVHVDCAHALVKVNCGEGTAYGALMGKEEPMTA